MRGIAHVVNLLRLPGPQSFGEISNVAPIPRRRELLREGGRIACHIERFGCDHTGSLAIAMVLAGDPVRQPGRNYRGPREPNDSN